MRLPDEHCLCLVNASAFASNEVNINEAQTSPDAAGSPRQTFPFIYPIVSRRYPRYTARRDAYVRAFADFPPTDRSSVRSFHSVRA